MSRKIASRKKNVQRMAKNKRKTLQEKIQNKRKSQILVKLQRKNIKNKHGDSVCSIIERNVGLDVIEHSKVNNIVHVRPVLFAKSKAFKAPCLPAHANMELTKCMEQKQSKFEAETSLNRSDVNILEPNCKTFNNQTLNSVEATVLLRDDERNTIKEQMQCIEQKQSIKEQVVQADTVSNRSDVNKSESNHESLNSKTPNNAETTVLCRNDERASEVAEPDDDLSIQLQKGQDDDMVSELFDDIDDSCTLDECTVCLPHTADEESMAQLKNMEKVKDEENSDGESIAILDGIETSKKMKVVVDELDTIAKKSSGLRMVKPEIEAKKLTIDNCTKLCNSLERQHLEQYQQIIFNPRYFRPVKYCILVNAIRSNGRVSVIPYRMRVEISRFLSLHHAEICSEHPILMRLARDGFFSDENGLVSCFFCGQMIHNILFLTNHHNQLIILLDNHNVCVRRRISNIPVDSYGSHMNLAALMAWMNQRLLHTGLCVPSGCQYREHVRRHFCEVARWIHENLWNIAPSGMHLPQRDLALATSSCNAQAVVPHNDEQVVPCANFHDQPSSVNQQAVFSSIDASALLSSIGEVVPASSLNNVVTPSQLGSIAEGESQQQIEEILVEQLPNEIIEEMLRLTDESLNTEETVRAELPCNSDNSLNHVEENSHLDVERELPELCSQANYNTSMNKTIHNNIMSGFTGGALTHDHGTGAEATAGIRVPEMADFDSRMQSYLHCSINQTPQALALNCFFHTGVADKVRCFICGGCLEKWQESDEPLLEHARHFPGCEFIWNTALGMYMYNDPKLPEVIDALVMSREGLAAVRDGFTHAQIYAAVERLIINREQITYTNIIAKLHDMDERRRV